MKLDELEQLAHCLAEGIIQGGAILSLFIMPLASWILVCYISLINPNVNQVMCVNLAINQL